MAIAYLPILINGNAALERSFASTCAVLAAITGFLLFWMSLLARRSLSSAQRVLGVVSGMAGIFIAFDSSSIL
jgi:hypothetical protein